MLASQLDLREAQQNQHLGELAEKEMGYILADLANVGTQAALFAGFVYSSVADPDETTPSGNSVVEDCLLVTITTATIVINLIVVTTSTFVATSGPYEALTGDDKALFRTLRLLQRERRSTMRWYWLGLLAFFLSLAVSVWFGPRKRASRVVMVGVSAAGLLVIRANQVRISRDLTGEARATCWLGLTPPSRPSPGVGRRNEDEAPDADAASAPSGNTVVLSSETAECPTCAAPLSGSYCGRCGCRVVIQCGTCKATLPPDAPVCLRCGARARDPLAEPLLVDARHRDAPGLDQDVQLRLPGEGANWARRRVRLDGGDLYASDDGGADALLLARSSGATCVPADDARTLRVVVAGDGKFDLRCATTADAEAWSAAIHLAAVAIGDHPLKKKKKSRRYFLPSLASHA